MNYLEDVKIDKHDLDNEWVEQPELCLKYSDAHAQAEYDLAKAKEQLEVVRAQLDSHIREAAVNRIVNGKPDPEKVTEAVVNNRIVLNQDYRTALAIYHEKQKVASMLKSAAITFATSRKEALENLVRLHLGNYYSKPVLAENRTAMDSVEQSSGYSSQVSGLNSSKKTWSEPGETFQSIPKKSFETPAQILKAVEKDFQPNPDPLLESIVSLAVTTAQEPTHKYAIGWEDSRRGYAAGPFDTEEQAYRNVGEDGMLLLKLGVGGAATPLAFWSEAECGWLPISEKTKGMKRPSPVPRPAPLKVK